VIDVVEGVVVIVTNDVVANVVASEKMLEGFESPDGGVGLRNGGFPNSPKMSSRLTATSSPPAPPSPPPPSSSPPPKIQGGIVGT